MRKGRNGASAKSRLLQSRALPDSKLCGHDPFPSRVHDSSEIGGQSPQFLRGNRDRDLSECEGIMRQSISKAPGKPGDALAAQAGTTMTNGKLFYFSYFFARCA